MNLTTAGLRWFSHMVVFGANCWVVNVSCVTHVPCLSVGDCEDFLCGWRV